MADRQSQDDASLAADAESLHESKSLLKTSVLEVEADRVSKIIPQEDVPSNLKIPVTAEDTDQETQEEATTLVGQLDAVPGVEDKVDKDVSATANEEVKEQADEQSQEREQPEEKEQSGEQEQSQEKEQPQEKDQSQEKEQPEEKDESHEKELSQEKEQLQEEEQLQEKEQSQTNLEIPKLTVEQAKSTQDASGLAEEAALPLDSAVSRSVVHSQATDVTEEQEPVKSSQIQLVTTAPADEVAAEEDSEKMTVKEKPASPSLEAPLDTEERFSFSTSEEIPEENIPEEDIQTAKDKILLKLHSAMAKQDVLRSNSLSLQSKISEFYRKNKLEFKRDHDKKPGVNEETYLRTLAQLQKLRDMVQRDYKQRQSYINSVKQRCQQKKEQVEVERKKWFTLLHKVVYGALFSNTRKPIPPNDVDHYLKALSAKENEVSKIRLRILKIKNKIKKNTFLLKSKEELEEGLHLQDFEQLKIENQTYNEKIEERNEDMLKLKKKISSTVQIMSHCKEKLHYVQQDNLDQVNNLKDVEASLVESRENLAKLKRVRDVLRTENAKLREECGLLGNKSLLTNYELKKEKVADLANKLQQVKSRHATLSSKCSILQNKIQMSSNVTTKK
ncbi:unnamed protein product [Candidula unifasciata]|uniref:CCDC113/CCDC96 coiled-coil domain-containing protein n=1 Tax=Candidula unifasciata TaxID=100452 RepID=A0A8S3YZA4_9EUPU|nr:unnamed protein product [Candidula unifasciata]